MIRSLFYIWSLVLILQFLTALHYRWDGAGEVCTIETESEQKAQSKKENESESKKDLLEDALLPVFLMPFNADSHHYISIFSQSLIHYCARCISPPPEHMNY